MDQWSYEERNAILASSFMMMHIKVKSKIINMVIDFWRLVLNQLCLKG